VLTQIINVGKQKRQSKQN